MLFLMRVVNITSLNKFYEQKQIHNALYLFYFRWLPDVDFIALPTAFLIISS